MRKNSEYVLWIFVENFQKIHNKYMKSRIQIWEKIEEKLEKILNKSTRFFQFF